MKLGEHANCTAKIYTSSWKKVKIIFAVRFLPWQVDISVWIHTAGVGGSRRSASQDATIPSCPFHNAEADRQESVVNSHTLRIRGNEKASRSAALAMESFCPMVNPQPMQLMVHGKAWQSWKLWSHRLQCLELLHVNCCVPWESLKCGCKEKVTN